MAYTPIGNAYAQVIRSTSGPVGTVQIGTVTTGAPGSAANVTNSGNSFGAILNFTIPQGPQGVGGTVGIGSVTQLNYTQQPTVVNVGTPQNAILNIGLPQGVPGQYSPAQAQYADFISDFIVEGLSVTVPSPASLTATLSTGTAVVLGQRTVVDSIPNAKNTYTYNSDTYVSLSTGGVVDYAQVDNGATAPDPPSGAVNILKVVTSASAVTSVEQLIPNKQNVLAVSSPPLYGPSSSRPQEFLSIGQLYLDTTLGQPIWCLTISPTTWVNAAGVSV